MLLRDLETYLSDYLKCADFDDDSINGLQVEGRDEIHSLAVGVSACAEVFQEAAEWGADAIIVHHGLFWRGVWPLPVKDILRERIGLLIGNDISLFAYHLPLDAHPEVGNNAPALKDLGARDLEKFGDYKGMKIGFKGRLPEPMARDAFLAKLENYYDRKPAVVVPGGPDPIRTIGLVSGGAAREAQQAVDEGLDIYVTGEPGEPTTYLCREAGLNFAAMGHYATERVGVIRLAAHLKEKFGLKIHFMDVENDA